MRMSMMWKVGDSKRSNMARAILSLMIIIVVFHKFIANELPIIADGENGITSPVLQDYLYSFGLKIENPHLTQNTYTPILSPLVDFNPYAGNIDQILLPPGTEGHLLGTDQLGRDVMTGLIYGTATAFIVGLYAVGIALLIAMIIGLISGYYNGAEPQFNLIQIGSILTGTFLFMFYLFSELQLETDSRIIFLLVLVLIVIVTFSIFQFSSRLKWQNFSFPISKISDKLIEIREAIPAIFLVLAALAIFQQRSIWNVILVIGFISWRNMARYIRAEVFKIKGNDYIKAARAQGMSHFAIMRKHILPNAIDPILATITFSIAAVILLEASLSFLGIGMPPEEPTWGSLLAQARKSNSWWLAVFPGICIFTAVYSLNVLADMIMEMVEVRLQEKDITD